MRKLIVLTVFLQFIIIAGCASTVTGPHGHDEFTKHYEESMFEITKNGLFSVELVVKEHKLQTGVNEIDLIIHDKNDEDVVGAEVTVTPWMPEMGHGVFERPSVTERGGGLYSVDNIILTMGGHWELRINVMKDNLEDSAVFDFPDVMVDMGHMHKTVEAPPPSELDLSTTRFSENKLFNVSYRSDIDPIPINKIHGWSLTISTPNGIPVTDAEISVVGDMPEHGHGLPTQPEVTQELDDGVYLVQGMKFSMPGWWVIKFNIRTEDKEDFVTFNLLVKK